MNLVRAYSEGYRVEHDCPLPISSSSSPPTLILEFLCVNCSTQFSLLNFNNQPLSLEMVITEASSLGSTLQGLDDVEEFVGGDSSSLMSVERLFHVSDLVQMGNQAFRDNRFEETRFGHQCLISPKCVWTFLLRVLITSWPVSQAINCYSRANTIKPGDTVILSNRCGAYLRFCQFLKHRPPSASEHEPLSGLDPTIHAELALKDAEKVMSIRSDSVKSYILKANALLLLERYELARDVILLGLQIDPISNPLSVLARIIASTIERRSQPERTDDFDCILCLKLLYEPITTPCGHSFCRSCLFQSMDRGNRCPLCRTVLFISPRTCAISVTLNNIIQKNFPEEYAERKLEHDSLSNYGADLLPLFVMDVILPCQKLQLNIFEPRYRLMVRRIMEGNRRMGMVITDFATGSIADVACEVEITECEPLPDGRFFLEIESRRRFRIIRNWDQDGYRVAEVEWLQDIYPSEGTIDRSDLQELTNNAAIHALQWMRRAREAAQHRRDRRKSLELDKAESMMPTTRDPECFSFWLATLTSRRPSERLQLLRMRDTKERMKRALIYMGTEEQGRVQ